MKKVIVVLCVGCFASGCSLVGAERLATRDGQGIFTLSADAAGLKAYGENLIGMQAVARDERNTPVEYFETRKAENALRFKAKVVKRGGAS